MFESHINRFMTRNWRMLAVFPKIFLCGFMWEAFAVICGCDDHSAAFYFATGFGGGLGTLTGHLLSYILPMFCFRWWTESAAREAAQALLYGLAVFLGPGTTWQLIVNLSVDWNIGFTAALAFMWAFSTILFFCSLLFFRALLSQLFSRSDSSTFQSLIAAVSSSSWQFDLQLSIAVGMADAVFVGTVGNGAFADNWMGPAFGVHDDTAALVAMLQSGASTLCGFVAVQLLFNASLPIHSSWLDADTDTDTNVAADSDGKLSASSNRKAKYPNSLVDSVVNSELHSAY